jgi:hypothetical protein
VYGLGDFTPKQLLRRPHLISTIAWTSTLPQVKFFWPSTEIITPFLSYLKDQAYLRSGVKFHFRFNSTPYHQGSLIVGYLPYARNSYYSTHTLTKEELSMMNPMIISASAQTELDYTLPYTAPEASFPIRTTYDYSNEKGNVGMLVVRALTPLRYPTGATDTLYIRVYACLDAPTSYGFGEQVSAQSQVFGLKREVKEKQEFLGAKVLVEGASQVLRSVPYVGQYYGPLADVLNESNLSRPTYEEGTMPMMIAPNRHFALCDSVFLGEPVSSQENINLNKMRYPGETNDMTVLELAMVPGMTGELTFSSSNLGSDIALGNAEPRTVPSTSCVDYLALVSSAFTYWRGGVRLAFYFCCNSFISARFQLSYRDKGPASLTNGNLIQQVLDVKGDTWHFITVPYISDLEWANTAETRPGLIQITMTNLVTTEASVTPYVDLIIFRSAAPDFQVALPRDVIRYNDAAQAMNVRELFIKEKFPIFQVKCEDICGTPQEPRIATQYGRCNPEKMYKISDLMKIPATTANGIYPEPQGSYVGDPDVQNDRRFFAWFGGAFMYWRGSVRVGTAVRPYYTLRAAADSTYDTYYSGIPSLSVAGAAQSGWLADIPYYERTPYKGNPVYTGRQETSNKFYTIADSSGTAVVSAGDDFQMFHLVPPAFTPLAATEGVSLFRKSKR